MSEARKDPGGAPPPVQATVNWSELARLHLWEIQPLRDLLLLLAAIGLVQLGYVARIVTVPLLIGVLLAYLFEPVVRRLARTTGRAVAALLVIVGAFVGIGAPLVIGTGVGIVQGAAFVEEVRRDLPSLTERADRAYRRVIDWAGMTAPEPDGSVPAPATEAKSGPAEPPEARREGPAQPASSAPTALQTWLEQHSPEVARALAGRGAEALQFGARALSTAGYVAFTVFFLVPFFFFFCSMSFGALQRTGFSLIPKQHRSRAVEILAKMDRAISGFIRGRLTICAILAVLFTIGYWVAGVPAPLIIGPITGALAIVPYLALLSWPTAIVMVWASQTDSAHASPVWLIVLAPTIAYWGVQAIDDYVLTPVIQGKNTGLDTPTILVAVLGAASLAGVYGVLVAIPVAACLRILITDVFWPRYKQWAEGKASDPLPLPEAPPAPAVTGDG